MHYSTLLSFLPLLGLTTAICPGYNYAFFNDDDNAMFYTTTTDCIVVKGQPCTNVCMCEWWGCGPAGSVNSLKVNGLWYACRDDANKGRCGPNEMSQVANNAPESCCRNDGQRNLLEGRITRRHALAIEETNSMLDRHVEEFEDARRGGEDLDVLSRRHADEMEMAAKREEAVAHAE
ncbi:uncharacterized protein BDV14DRAFT_195882 [Aspergillus stella-maris]|uniref:uncharacterized protein n=1 Tax=Aspergillus stella-maris TaxID=1810926 RepID=UPI003CCD553A